MTRSTTEKSDGVMRPINERAQIKIGKGLERESDQGVITIGQVIHDRLAEA